MAETETKKRGRPALKDRGGKLLFRLDVRVERWLRKESERQNLPMRRIVEDALRGQMLLKAGAR